MNKFKISIIVLFCGTFMAACGNKKEEEQNSSGLKYEYYKNIQFNVKGYQAQGFNPLPKEVVAKTDGFLFISDKDGKLLEFQFVLKGKLEDSYTYGFAKQVYRYTDSSIVFSQYDKFGKRLPMSRPNGANTIYERELILENGMPSVQRGLGYNGEPLLNFIQKKYECDSLGRIVWESNMDEFGKPIDITQRQGVYYRKYSYNEQGLMTSSSFYEIQSEKRSLGGVHLVGYSYGPQGNIVKNAFYDENLNLINEPNTGIAYRMMKYNKFGNLTEQAFYDKSDKPVRNDKGFSMQRSKYDENSNNILNEFFDEERNPISNREIGAFAEKLTYDEKGDLVLSEFLNENGKLMTSEVLKYAYKALEYNQDGLISSEAYFGENNAPIMFQGLGAHVKLSKYDSLERLVETKFLNEDGQSFIHPACGCASIKFMHDSLGKVTEEKYLNLKGELTEKGPKNVAKRKYLYDSYGELQMIEYFKANGEEIVIEGSNPYLQ